MGLFDWGDEAEKKNVWVRPPLRTLRPLRQICSTLCWLTCYQMLYTWKGLDPNTIEGKLRRAGLDYHSATLRGLYPHEFLTAAIALGLRAEGFGQPITILDIKAALKYSPLWISGEWFRGSNHSRVVIGANDDWVEYYDPWWGGTAGGYYADDLKHKDLAQTFLHGDGSPSLRGTDSVFQSLPLQYWKP